MHETIQSSGGEDTIIYPPQIRDLLLSFEVCGPFSKQQQVTQKLQTALHEASFLPHCNVMIVPLNQYSLKDDPDFSNHQTHFLNYKITFHFEGSKS